MYFDKLAYIVNGYNDTYLRTIKIKPFDVNSSTYLTSIRKWQGKS